MALPDALRPMLASLVDRLPAGPGWLYEPKWDGFRCLAIVETDRTVRLVSRRGTSLNAAFPELVTAVGRQLPAGTIADGEIVRWSTDGRLDFEALQRRNRSASRGARDLARTEPCHLILFDLLRLRDQDLTGAALTERRAQLEDPIAGTGAAAVVVGMQTDNLEVARTWFDQLAAVGVEGIVAERAREPYRPGARSWVKVKHYATTEAVVGGSPVHWNGPNPWFWAASTAARGSCTSPGAAPNCTRRPPNRSQGRSPRPARIIRGRRSCRRRGTTAPPATTTA